MFKFPKLCLLSCILLMYVPLLLTTHLCGALLTGSSRASEGDLQQQELPYRMFSPFGNIINLSS
ncbi:MAG: hypothetical protein HC925_05535 [Coleofasciculaceae cyanobacterium SM2_3_26]|nr:hypothetical protein [Coleofasciculaceae cyanobacterium SM2_3_26]